MSPRAAVWLNRASAVLAIIVMAGGTIYVASEQPAWPPTALSRMVSGIQPLGAIRCLMSRHR